MQPDQTTIIVIVAALSFAALILWFLYRTRRTASLRDRFGAEEYDRMRGARGARMKAHDDLTARDTRLAALELRPLAPAERQRFADEWHAARGGFVDDPAAAVCDADRVVRAVMGARGYPVDDFDARYETLMVDHAEVARHYRAGHDGVLAAANGMATPADLRQTMVHYEALFDTLANDHPDRPGGTISRQSQVSRRHPGARPA